MNLWLLCPRNNPCLVLMVPLFCMLASTVSANEIPWASKDTIHYRVHKKDLRELLRDLASRQGVSAIIANDIQGNITGTFDMKPQTMLERIASRHHLSWRYDGKILYITQTGKMQISSADPIKDAAGDTAGTANATDTNLQLAHSLAASSEASPHQKEAPTIPLVDIETPQVSPAQTLKYENSEKHWDITPSDQTLKAAMSRWAVEAGWQLFWELPIDYRVESSTSLLGNFEEAVETVIKSMEKADVPMEAIFYRGNKVLRILAKEAQ